VSGSKIRRAQLVSPFGVGAMSVLVNGTSVVTAGLDHWYPEDSPDFDPSEYIEHDWRLEARLHVSEFRLPPDFRPSGHGDDQRNVRLRIPVLRFPRWHFCLYCKRLHLVPLTVRTQVECPDKEHAGKLRRPRMAQVPFVAVCAHGHLDDFPFEKWVHRSHKPSCTGILRLSSRGAGGLEGQVVTCDVCKGERSLAGIMEGRRGPGGEERTTLTDQLSGPGDPFWCAGARPWLAAPEDGCGGPVRAALRAAGNVYFPKVESSIYLPRREGTVSAEMHDLLRSPQVGPRWSVLHDMLGDDVPAAQLRKGLIKLFAPYSDEELVAAFRDLFGPGGNQQGETPPGSPGVSDDLTGSDEWRRPEYLVIRETPKDDFLSADDPGIHEELADHFDRVRSVNVLRETRTLRGFTRVRDDVLKLNTGKALLRRESLPPGEDWLPAYVVKGEGVYLEFNAVQLTAWESRAEVRARADMLAIHYGAAAGQRGTQPVLTPRFIMIHTMAHLLINELIFTCGYSSASLRERLYVSEAAGQEMAGLLIYTAAGDSEGTMGGLVRMARKDNLRQVVGAALDDARWCSADPVCMDVGEKGQGPDSCNLAACHGCALLPETSCEEFNRFLDRGLVIGTLKDTSLGFF
jgi:hypothetical protein